MSSNKTKAEERAARAAALIDQQRRAERRRNLLSVMGVVLVLVIIVGGSVLFTLLKHNDEKVKSSDVGSSDYGLVVGKASAPHKLVLYEDFLCPICGILESTSGKDINKEIADGQVQVDYRPINLLSRNGPYSAEALNAFYVVQDKAGGAVAKKFHDILYANQPNEEGPYPDKDWLVQRAVEAGATKSDVESGIENMSMQDKVDKATDAALNGANVQGTPTILLDGKQFAQGSSWQDIAKNLVKAIQQ